MKITTALILFLLLLIFPAGLYAASPQYVDFDGDGFDDNIIDLDNNGIPDQFQKKVKSVHSSGNYTFSPGSFGQSKENNPALELTKSQNFSLYKFRCRTISGTRSDFESDFNSGININSSSGSSCAGGVCF